MDASIEPETVPVVQKPGYVQWKWTLGDELVGRNPYGELGPTPRCVNAGPINAEPIIRPRYRPLLVEDLRAP